ncbi:MAG: TIGR03364 family FAD-dependent oxidoreductase, partial [Planctomycetota bacterium]
MLLFERNLQARGASARNFGMVWPIGQRSGPMFSAALASRALWHRLLEETGVWGRPCGALHLAYREDERQVLAEFAESAAVEGRRCELIDAAQALQLSPAARKDGLLGALWSPTEIGVDPREAMHRAPGWLQRRYGVQLLFGTWINHVEGRCVASAAGDRWTVEKVIVAAGADLDLLYPQLFKAAGFQRCKLQMMRTRPQPHGWALGPMLAGGLTLRHYEAFAGCRSLVTLRERIAAETPELDRYGIHVLA